MTDLKDSTVAEQLDYETFKELSENREAAGIAPQAYWFMELIEWIHYLNQENKNLEERVADLEVWIYKEKGMV